MRTPTTRAVRTWLDRRRRWRRNSDPPPAPPGWATAPPDFVGVGVEKAGTSWWYELVVAHPRVERPQLARKELRYFNRFGNRSFVDENVERYAALFPRPPGRLCGEWTPSYLSDFWVPPLLHRCAPQAHVLVIVRDPVQRYVSGIAQALQSGHADSLAERRRAFDRGCYASQLERLWRWFPREQTLVLQYEECRERPHVVLRRTYEFLGLDPTFVPEGIEREVHPSRWPKPTLDNEALRDLTVAYSPEIERLGALCPELDLSRWGVDSS